MESATLKTPMIDLSQDCRNFPAMISTRFSTYIYLIVIVFPTYGQNWQTSWLGNSLGTSSGKWVQNNIAALSVATDGTCCTDSYWDEGGHEAGIYRNGDQLAACLDTHGHGGFAAAVDGSFVWIAYATDNHAGAVRRYDLHTGQLAPIHHDGSTDPGVELTSSINSIRGLAVVGDELFISDFDANTIHIVNTRTLRKERSLPFERPQRLVGQVGQGPMDSLWVIQAKDNDHPAKVLRIKRDGSPLPQRISDVDDPVAVALDPAGKLLIADNGPDQQIKIYGNLNDEPRLVGTLGKKGGVLAAPRGRTGPLRFNGLTGVGIDAAKNIYVSDNGLGPYFADHPGFGAELKCFAPSQKLKWQLQGLEFVNTAVPDPANDTTVFTSTQRHTLDFSQPPGKGWSFDAFTLDRFAYPNDPRLHLSAECVLAVREFDHRRYLYLSDMYSRFVIVYRFEADSEIAVPCAMFGREHLKENWPEHQPADGAWLWRDAKGNGDMEADEFESIPGDNQFVWGWSVDANGTVWKALRENGIRRFPLHGFDGHGNPIYRVQDSQVIDNPQPFQTTASFKGDISRVEYDPASDTMYLSGYTSEHPNTPSMWGLVGTVICRYDHWSQGNRQMGWQIVLRYDAMEAPNKKQTLPKAMSIAGDFLFVAYMQQPRILVYNLKTANLKETIMPRAPVRADEFGWVDLPYGMKAFARSDGRYIVFTQEELHGRIVFYLGKP